MINVIYKGFITYPHGPGDITEEVCSFTDKEKTIQMTKQICKERLGTTDDYFWSVRERKV